MWCRTCCIRCILTNIIKTSICIMYDVLVFVFVYYGLLYIICIYCVLLLLLSFLLSINGFIMRIFFIFFPDSYLIFVNCFFDLFMVTIIFFIIIYDPFATNYLQWSFIYLVVFDFDGILMYYIDKDTVRWSYLLSSSTTVSLW